MEKLIHNKNSKIRNLKEWIKKNKEKIKEEIKSKKNIDKYGLCKLERSQVKVRLKLKRKVRRKMK